MDRAQPLNIGTWRIRGEGTAVQALAWHADCQQPVHIALLVDRTLRLGARGAGGSPVWVMSMVSNALSVLASMQADVPSAALLSEVVVRKAVRARVPLSALALKMMRTEVLAPLLQQPLALPVAARNSPAWRANLDAVCTLHHWHGYDVVTSFSVVALRNVARGAGLRTSAASEAATSSTLARVVQVISSVHEWWRQPEARAILASTPEAELWRHFMRRRGASGSEAHGDRLHRLLTSSSLVPPAPMALEQRDVAAYGLLMRTALARAGCLKGGSGSGSSSGGIRAAIFSVTPGCAELRAYMRSASGRAAYLKPYGTGGGPLQALVRSHARVTLLVRMCRDALVVQVHSLVHAAAAHVKRHMRAAARNSPPRSSSARTLFDWMISSDPWTVVAATVAAALAVLRLIVRLLSAFAPAVGQAAPTPPHTQLAARTGTAPANPAALAAAAGRKNSRRGAKARQRVRQKATPIVRGPVGQPAAAGAQADVDSDPHVAHLRRHACEDRANAADPADVSVPNLATHFTFDPVAMRLRCAAAPYRASGPLLLQRAASERPGAESALQAACGAGSLARWNPPLAADIASALPTMLVHCSSLPHVQQPCMAVRQHAALARLQEAQQRVKQPSCAKGQASPRVSASEAFISSRAEDGALAPQPLSPPPAALDLESDDSCSAAAADEDVLAALGGRVECLGQSVEHGAHEAASVPAKFRCALSRSIMDSPVLAADEHVYEREHIEAWLRSHDTSPVTSKRLQHKALLPVLTLRAAIQAFKNVRGELTQAGQGRLRL